MNINQDKATSFVALFALVFWLQLIAPTRASAQLQPTAGSGRDGAGAYVYGPGHRYHLNAAKGWTVDTAAGKSNGLGAVFYPDGSSWQDAPVVMYTRILDHDGKTFAQVVDGDLNAMSRNSKTFRAIDKSPIVSLIRQTALVKDLTGEASGQLERVAYFEEKHWVVIIVLVSHSEAALKEAVPAFEQVVKSYHYVSDGATK